AVAGELDRIDGCAEAGVGIAVDADLDVLRSHTQYGASDVGTAEAADPDVAGTREDAVVDLATDEIHRRRAAEASNEDRRRVRVDLLRRSKLLHHALRHARL